MKSNHAPTNFYQIKKKAAKIFLAPPLAALMGRINLEVRLQFALCVQFSIFLCSGNENSRSLLQPLDRLDLLPLRFSLSLAALHFLNLIIHRRWDFICKL
jgi:hypothetical protein